MFVSERQRESITPLYNLKGVLSSVNVHFCAGELAVRVVRDASPVGSVHLLDVGKLIVLTYPLHKDNITMEPQSSKGYSITIHPPSSKRERFKTKWGNQIQSKALPTSERFFQKFQAGIVKRFIITIMVS